jgi:hypothetical protein
LAMGLAQTVGQPKGLIERVRSAQTASLSLL